MSGLIDWGSVSYAFTVGMVATFNPCGFAMLPAYLSFFLGLDDDTEDASGGVLRALAVGATMTGGFLVVFGLVGVLIESVSAQVQDYLPWVTLVIGVGLLILGGRMLLGHEVSFKLPFLNRGATSRDLPSVFVFGVSYALVSLGCSIGLFLTAVSSTFKATNIASGVATYVAYGLGMGLVLMVLTMALALARRGIVAHMRKIVPYVNRIAAVLLVLAGVYVIYYGWFELRVADDASASGGGLVAFMNDLQSRIISWIDSVGAGRIGNVLGGVVLAAVVLALGIRSYRRGGTGTTESTTAA
ncbi:MAG: cytochrome c biogenesis protein CcdA [Acidimicrobiales bacterium]|nr:cytochrome c biogenesis protein CcdA [Acidimicrobiales bacterium]